MRRTLMLLPVILLAAATARAEPGETKVFKAKNFKWILPSKEWAFVATTPEQDAASYVAAVNLDADGGVRAYARVVAKGPSADAIAQEVRRTTTAGLKEVASSSISEDTLSGLDGSLVSVTGTAKSGGTLWFRGYATVLEGTLYQLLIEALNGAETKRGEEIEALKRGFRLLHGAGPEDEVVIDVPRKPVPPGKPSGEGEKKPPAGNKPADKPKGGSTTFPPNGPKLEGRTAVLPSHNLRWTLPDGSPFDWSFATQDEKKTKQQVLGLRARVPRTDVKEGEPRTNDATVALSVTPLEEGVTAQVVVNDQGLRKSIVKEVFDGKIDASKTRVEPDVPVGNGKGARLWLAGGGDQTGRHFAFVAVCLKAVRYSFEVSLVGGQDVREALAPAVDALFAGIEFIDVKAHVRGPLAVPGVAAHDVARGKGGENDLEFTIPGVTGMKPKGMVELTFDGKAEPALRIAFEVRTPDGQTYFYFDVHTYDPVVMQKERTTPEELISIRETAWRTAVGEDAVTVLKGKDPWFDATFAGLKGVGYQFSGTSDGFPFVEQGWLVKTKKNVLWFRMQFGGEGAEKAMEPFATAMKKVKPT